MAYPDGNIPPFIQELYLLKLIYIEIEILSSIFHTKTSLYFAWATCHSNFKALKDGNWRSFLRLTAVDIKMFMLLLYAVSPGDNFQFLSNF